MRAVVDGGGATTYYSTRLTRSDMFKFKFVCVILLWHTCLHTDAARQAQECMPKEQ